MLTHLEQVYDRPLQGLVRMRLRRSQNLRYESGKVMIGSGAKRSVHAGFAGQQDSHGECEKIYCSNSIFEMPSKSILFVERVKKPIIFVQVPAPSTHRVAYGMAEMASAKTTTIQRLSSAIDCQRDHICIVE